MTRLPEADGTTAVTLDLRNRRNIIIAAVAGVVLAALALFIVVPALSGGSEAEAVTIPHAARSKAAAAPSATTATPAPTASAAPDPAAGGTRDPFAPLPEEAAAQAATTAATTDSGTASTGSADANSTATTTTGTTDSTASELPVQLIGVDGTTASVEVDSKPYAVTKGKAFANGYTCVEVSTDSVTISHGSKSETLAKGELKTF